MSHLTQFGPPIPEDELAPMARRISSTTRATQAQVRELLVRFRDEKVARRIVEAAEAGGLTYADVAAMVERNRGIASVGDRRSLFCDDCRTFQFAAKVSDVSWTFAYHEAPCGAPCAGGELPDEVLRFEAHGRGTCLRCRRGAR